MVTLEEWHMGGGFFAHGCRIDGGYVLVTRAQNGWNVGLYEDGSDEPSHGFFVMGSFCDAEATVREVVGGAS